MLDFEPLNNAKPVPGLVLRIGESEKRYLRLTHVFDNCVYAMWVGDPENARYARRPTRKSLRELQRLAAEPASQWGRLALPPALSQTPPLDSERALELDAAWGLIEPLIKSFESEHNLSRFRFTPLIRERAQATQTSFITLFRMVLRYYYFGGTKLALLSLPPGTKPTRAGYAHVGKKEAGKDGGPKRRGRQPVLASELGANDFIVTEADIADMVACLKTCLRKGPTFISTAHEDYLAEYFRKRYPKIHAEYIAGKRVEPVTPRQFRYYIGTHAQLDEELAKNLRTQERNPGYLGSLRAAGPGEVYEIDATGGRLYVITADDPPIFVGKPTIYLIIDRWSRFVVSVYLSLRAPSYEEVRHALLIAFTPREARFRALGVDIDDERWPKGRMPAELCADRGAEFMSDSLEQAVVSDLRIELTPLPPFCPDGKAIVERLIRELKRRMASSKMKGVYADRPLDPQTKRASRRAKAAAVHSLAEVYRKLIEIIDQHNNRPHSALRRRRVLTQAGVKPTPKSAYLWGLKHITGLRSAPLTDSDYRRLLLSVDTASIANGLLRFRRRPYQPVNEAAFGLAAKSTSRAKSIGIRLDKTDPREISVPTTRGEWAVFRITPGGASELAGLSLDEEEAFASQTARLWARAEHEARVERVAAKNAKTEPVRRRRASPAEIDKKRQLAARAKETDDLKKKLHGNSPRRVPKAATRSSASSEDWTKLEEQERLRNLELVRKHRSRQ